ACAHPERADPAHEGPRLRRRLPVRPRNRGYVLRTELLPGGYDTRAVLPPARSRLRTRDQQAARLLGEAARRTEVRLGTPSANLGTRSIGQYPGHDLMVGWSHVKQWIVMGVAQIRRNCG